MIKDLRAKLVSVLGISTESTDGQLLAAVKALRTQRDVYRDMHARSWAPVQMPWSAIVRDPTITLVLAKGAETAKVWMITGRDIAEDGIAIEATSEKGEAGNWVFRPDDTSTVLAPMPETVAKLLLMRSELGAKYQEVGT